MEYNQILNPTTLTLKNLLNYRCHYNMDLSSLMIISNILQKMTLLNISLRHHHSHYQYVNVHLIDNSFNNSKKGVRLIV